MIGVSLKGPGTRYFSHMSALEVNRTLYSLLETVCFGLLCRAAYALVLSDRAVVLAC